MDRWPAARRQEIGDDGTRALFPKIRALDMLDRISRLLNSNLRQKIFSTHELMTDKAVIGLFLFIIYSDASCIAYFHYFFLLVRIRLAVFCAQNIRIIKDCLK